MYNQKSCQKNQDFLKTILPLVEKPGRYIGGEVNSILRTGVELTRVALFFPDLYEIGMSNLGFKILYELVNEQEDFVAERVYSPWPDFEEILLSQNLTLFTLESRSSLIDFDIIAFTLQYELTFTNVLNGLKLAGLPLKSRDRDHLNSPLVIAGGPVSSNPEPISDFIDAFCIGEGEEVLLEILQEVRKGTFEGIDRTTLLLNLSKIPGVYVPRFYELKSENHHHFVSPTHPMVPEKIQKRIFEDFVSSHLPKHPVTPNIPITHDRAVVELFRGCPHACRYCQAVKFYNKTRIRTPEQVLSLIKTQLDSTGYSEVSLSSLSTTDYPFLPEVVKVINENLPDISISLPSLRIDKSLQFFSDKISDIGDVKRQNMTLAPECGTDRLRKALRKSLTNDQLLEMVGMAFAKGVEVVKLYYMVGLPTETDEDIEGIIQMGEELSTIGYRFGRRKRVKLSINPFVPKSHTAFQWDGMNILEELEGKQKKVVQGLKRHKNLELTYRDPVISYLECLFSRGDRRLGELLEIQLKKGYRFDGWYHFSKEALEDWRSSGKALGIDTDLLVFHPIEKNSRLPWEHINLFTSNNSLKMEREKAESTLFENSIR